jgi:tripartite-type tricarboxylate transporter receptor subunit TctC
MIRMPMAATLAVCTLLTAAGHEAQAQSVEEFYKGKQIRIIISAAPATDYDMFARLISARMTKLLPGNPSFIHQNMPGAGGIIATNHLFSAAAQDGSVLGMVNRNMPHVALTKMANVKFDPPKFNWLGSPEISNSVCVALTGVPVQKAEDLFERELLIGGAGAGSAPTLTSRLLSNLLGMRLKVVDGYKSVPDVSLAMMRSEVHGVCQSLNALRGGNLTGWIEADKLKVLFNLEEKPITGIPSIKAPSVFNYAKTDEQRAILRLNASVAEMGRPMLTPPNVPADRVAALRKAFNGAVNDPSLHAEVEKVFGQVTLVTGERMQQLVGEIASTPPELSAKMEKMMSGK